MTDILTQGRELAERYNRQGEGYRNEGKKNAYECDGSGGRFGLEFKPGCGSFIVTVDRHPGVTPFIVRCGNCGGEAHSKFYRVQHWLEPTHEWYRPETLEGVPATYHDHLSNGGLILRAIPGVPDKWSRPRDADPKRDEYETLRQMIEMKRKIEAADRLGGDEITNQMSRQERRYRERKDSR